MGLSAPCQPEVLWEHWPSPSSPTPLDVRRQSSCQDGSGSSELSSNVPPWTVVCSWLDVSSPVYLWVLPPRLFLSTSPRSRPPLSGVVWFHCSNGLLHGECKKLFFSALGTLKFWILYRMLQYFIQCKKTNHLIGATTLHIFSRLLVHQRQGLFPHPMGSSSHPSHSTLRWNACVLFIQHFLTLLY